MSPPASPTCYKKKRKRKKKKIFWRFLCFKFFLYFYFFIECVPSELRSTHALTQHWQPGLRGRKSSGSCLIYTTGRVTEMDQSSSEIVWRERKKKKITKGRWPLFYAWWWNHEKRFVKSSKCLIVPTRKLSCQVMMQKNELNSRSLVSTGGKGNAHIHIRHATFPTANQF